MQPCYSKPTDQQAESSAHRPGHGFRQMSLRTSVRADRNGVRSYRTVPLTSALRRPGARSFGSVRRRTYPGAEIQFRHLGYAPASSVGTITIQDTPKRSATIPKRGEKKVLANGI